MDSRTHGSSCGFQHLLPALAQVWIANSHHEPIGSRRWVPGQTQGAEHGDGGHKLIGGTAVIKKPKHGIALRSDGISNRAAMAAGSEDQPTVWHQLWDATAKGTATR